MGMIFQNTIRNCLGTAYMIFSENRFSPCANAALRLRVMT